MLRFLFGVLNDIMNKEIVDNLYELWSYIGVKTDRLIKTEEYCAVSMKDSDWPNRIFSVSNNTELLSKVISLSNDEILPGIITMAKPHLMEHNKGVQLLFGQKNMALELQNLEGSFDHSENIYEVKSELDELNFANTASKAFGYHVDSETVHLVNQNPSKIKFFNYVAENECLGCGIVYFDSFNNAGLHMIGTVPNGRGKGVGKKMTERLLAEAINNDSRHCVLHASQMGEPIYKKLGFRVYGELETYRIV